MIVVLSATPSPLKNYTFRDPGRQVAEGWGGEVGQLPPRLQQPHHLLHLPLRLAGSSRPASRGAGNSRLVGGATASTLLAGGDAGSS